MENRANKSADYDADYFLDITTEVCPLTFVRTKLLMERMSSGEVAVVRLQGEEPLINVPQALRAQGHLILEFAAEEPGTSVPAVHRLRIKKR